MAGFKADVRKVVASLRGAVHGHAVGVLLAAGLFVWMVQWRVATYVCGNDPMLYIRAARTLLRPDFYGAEAVRHALTFVAPGYPVFLAGVIKLFGPLSPYWINAVVLTAALPLMWFVFRRLMGSARAAAFALLGWLWIIFSGHPLHAPFLLYPFRETPRLFLVFMAYAGVLMGMRAVGRRRRVGLVGAGLLLMAACAVREPSALVLPGLILGMGGLSGSWSGRFRAWGWFLAPWILAGGAAWVVLSAISIQDFSQFSVMGYLGNHGVALERAGKMLSWFPQKAGGGLGLLLIALGLARAAWKSRVLLAWFLFPAVLFFAFCAYMQMHDRYFLTSLLFLAVFAGYGLDGLCRLGERGFSALPARWSRWARPGSILLTGGLLILLFTGLVRTARQVAVWGPAVTAAEVREWQALVSHLDPSRDGRVRIAVEQRARYLEDMLMSYTDAELLDPKQMAAWPADWAPAHYFKPLNHKALWATQQWLMYLNVFADRIIEHRSDLLPVAEGEEGVRLIGAGRYAQYRITPWQAGGHEQAVALVPGMDQTLWLDFGGSDPEMKKDIRVKDAATGEVWSHHPMAGGGLQAIFLAGEQVRGENAVLAVQGEGPLPARPLVAVACAEEGVGFDLGRDRRLSINSVFPERTREDANIYCPVLRSARDLPVKMPPVLSEIPVRWEMVLNGNIPAGASVWRLPVVAGDPAEPPCEVDSGAGQIRCGGAGGEAILLRLVAAEPGGGPVHMDLTAIEFRARRQVGRGGKIGGNE